MAGQSSAAPCRPGPRRRPTWIGLFLISLTVGRFFHLGYAETATLVFTTSARNSESVIGVAAVAGHPLVLVSILVGPVIEPPALLLLSRVELRLRSQLRWPEPDPGSGDRRPDDTGTDGSPPGPTRVIADTGEGRLRPS